MHLGVLVSLWDFPRLAMYTCPTVLVVPYRSAIRDLFYLLHMSVPHGASNLYTKTVPCHCPLEIFRVCSPWSSGSWYMPVL